MENGIDLMLAGHTHGGQMFPATLISQVLFPFNKGLYVQGNTQIYVSQGAGTFGPRLRLGTRNEITQIKLVESEK
jgi:predicted MPP superfamily phosphohydrolase